MRIPMKRLQKLIDQYDRHSGIAVRKWIEISDIIVKAHASDASIDESHVSDWGGLESLPHPAKIDMDAAGLLAQFEPDENGYIYTIDQYIAKKEGDA